MFETLRARIAAHRLRGKVSAHDKALRRAELAQARLDVVRFELLAVGVLLEALESDDVSLDAKVSAAAAMIGYRQWLLDRHWSAPDGEDADDLA
jgi:hypothetical protein